MRWDFFAEDYCPGDLCFLIHDSTDVYIYLYDVQRLWNFVSFISDEIVKHVDFLVQRRVTYRALCMFVYYTVTDSDRNGEKQEENSVQGFSQLKSSRRITRCVISERGERDAETIIMAYATCTNAVVKNGWLVI